jgi:hypothetical protein
MENLIFILILVSALGLMLYLRRQEPRRSGRPSFKPSSYDYSDQSDDGLGTSAFPPATSRRRGERGMLDDDSDRDNVIELPDFHKNRVQATPPPKRIVHPRRINLDDRRPASDGDVLLSTLLLGTATGVTMQGDDAPESSQASDVDDRQGFGGGSSNYSNDPGESSGGGGGGGE